MVSFLKCVAVPSRSLFPFAAHAPHTKPRCPILAAASGSCGSLVLTVWVSCRELAGPCDHDAEPGEPAGHHASPPPGRVSVIAALTQGQRIGPEAPAWVVSGHGPHTASNPRALPVCPPRTVHPCVQRGVGGLLV